jgi:nucleotide-binding universal stress UspA family protein
MTNETDTPQLVVVGVDGSAESIAALGWAGRYAAATGAKVRAVLAWHYPTTAAVPPVGLTPEPINKEVTERMDASLAGAVDAVFPGASAQVERQLTYGHPAEVLVEESKGADLLVVGSRGHAAFTGMLVGSVSIHCVTHASCPVVVVRSRD